jgi:hypothetical protein
MLPPLWATDGPGDIQPLCGGALLDLIVLFKLRPLSLLFKRLYPNYTSIPRLKIEYSYSGRIVYLYHGRLKHPTERQKG